MVGDPERDPLDSPVGDERRCAVCQHAEADHVLRDVVATRDRRQFCTSCEDWHEFVPTPLDL